MCGGWCARVPRMPCVCAGGCCRLCAQPGCTVCSVCVRARVYVCVCVRLVGAAALRVPPPLPPWDPAGQWRGSTNRDPGKFVAPSPGHPVAPGGGEGGLLQAVLCRPLGQPGGGGSGDTGDPGTAGDTVILGPKGGCGGHQGPLGHGGHRNTVAEWGGRSDTGVRGGHRGVQGHGRRGATQQTGGGGHRQAPGHRCRTGCSDAGDEGGRREGRGQRGHGT